MSARKITVSFGLMSVPMKMEVAVDKPASLSNLCVGQPGHETHPASPIKMPKVCSTCGDVTDPQVLVKGLKAGDTYTLVDPSEVTEAKEKFTAGYKGALALVAHSATEFATATAQGDSLHYLMPADATAEGHYQLLMRLVAEHPEVAFAGLHTPVSATGLYQLRVRDGALMLEKRTREQAVKPAPSIGGQPDETLYQMLSAALPALTTPYSAEAYEDHYGAAVAELVSRGEQIAVDSPNVPITKGTDPQPLMAWLSDVMKKEVA